MYQYPSVNTYLYKNDQKLLRILADSTNNFSLLTLLMNYYCKHIINSLHCCAGNSTVFLFIVANK